MHAQHNTHCFCFLRLRFVGRSWFGAGAGIGLPAAFVSQGKKQERAEKAERELAQQMAADGAGALMGGAPAGSGPAIATAGAPLLDDDIIF